jgi:XTP/dITP diphosphohydrolase
VIHTLVVASSSRGKLGELVSLLEGLPVQVVAMDEVLRPPPKVVEDGATFAENAAKKAKTIAAACLCLTLADDSGLEVDALNGRPGVRSARFAHERATDAENNAALVTALEALGDPTGLAEGAANTARFRCVLALVDPYAAGGDGEVAFSDGVCEGAITLSARGSHGFGYDPLFVVAGQEKAGQAQTMAELSEAEKNAVSHRSRAVIGLRPILARMIEAREAVIRRVEEAASRRPHPPAPSP